MSVVQKRRVTLSMKRSNLSKAVGASVLTLSMAILPLILSSCADAPENNVEPNTVPPAGVIYTRDRDDFSCGWLWLIGLIGLAGLGGKKRREPTAYREPDRWTVLALGNNTAQVSYAEHGMSVAKRPCK